MADHQDEPLCFKCSSLLIEPYMQCRQCEKSEERGPVTLCLHCFSKGAEFDQHKSDHSYYLVVGFVLSNKFTNSVKT